MRNRAAKLVLPHRHFDWSLCLALGFDCPNFSIYRLQSLGLEYGLPDCLRHHAWSVLSCPVGHPVWDKITQPRLNLKTYQLAGNPYEMVKSRY